MILPNLRLRLSRIVLIVALTVGLGACGKKQNDDAVPAAPAEQPTGTIEKPPAITIDLAAITAEIPAVDELGRFQSDVSGIAFWQHPTKPYESGIFAAQWRGWIVLAEF